LGSPSAQADWGGTISGSAASSDVDNVRSTAIDQQYTLYATDRPTPHLRYTLSGLYRRLQTSMDNGPYTWLTEVRPAGSLDMNLPILNLRGDGSYRSDQNELGTTKLTSGVASVKGQTVWTRFPRLFASASWAKNVNDLELLGYDTRTRTYATGGTFSSHNIFAHYEYSDLLTRNPNSDLDRVSRSHNGRADYTKSLIERLVNVQTSYQITSRTERDNSSISGELLVPLTASAGLYLADPSPDFDALESSPALIDGILGLPAGDDYDLVNGETHNFGLDFGVKAAVDHLHLYVDTLTSVPMTWTVWRSSDNLSWTPILSSVSAPFSSVFLRYEFAFAAVETRYIKVSVASQLLNTPIDVTELRGLVVNSDDGDETRTTDQRGSVRLRVQPSKWFSWDVSGDALRQKVSLSTLARDEDGVQTSLRFNPDRCFDLSMRYQWTRSHYTKSSNDDGKTSSINAVARTQWSHSISTTTSVERSDDESGNILIRRGDRTRLDIRTLLLPALRVTTQLSYSEDERFDSPDKLFSRSVTNTFDGEPTRRSQLSVTHRYETRSARVSAVHKYRVALGGRLSYRLTDTIHMTTNATRSADPTREDRFYDGVLSWLPTSKISLGGSVSRIEGTSATTATQYSIQSVYRWSVLTEISMSYSLNEREDEATSSSGRVSLYTRF